MDILKEYIFDDIPISKLRKLNLNSESSSESESGIIIEFKSIIVKVQQLQVGYYSLNLDMESIYFHNGVEISVEDYNLNQDEISSLFRSRSKTVISIKDFKHEVHMSEMMSKMHIAPRFFKSRIIFIGKFAYGAIYMKKVSLIDEEFALEYKSLILKKIRKLHKSGYYHGDLQLANIGFRFRRNKCRIYIFDWFNSGKLFSGAKKLDLITFFSNLNPNHLS